MYDHTLIKRRRQDLGRTECPPSLSATQVDLALGRWITRDTQGNHDIGKTVAGSVVLVDTKSIKRGGDTVTATVRTRFVKADGDGVTMTRTVATFNCSNGKVAVKENDSYAGAKLLRKSVPGKPGYGVVFGGSMTGVAYEYLCAKKP